uniref:MAM domain-containing protein n=1 Tax=Denticeps clupeoides TaxID=299321 RepID=A0AAY4DRE8_9TELE
MLSVCTSSILHVLSNSSFEFVCAGLQCDFEEGLCGLFNGPNEDRGWSRGTGQTSSGPEADARGNFTGHYLSLRSPNGEKAIADLISPVFLPSDSCKVEFYWHFGKVIGELQVLIQSNSGSKNVEVAMWTTQMPSTDTDIWQQTVVPLKSNTEFQVIIRGQIFSNTDHLQSLAIDDLSFSQGCDTLTDQEHLLSSFCCANGECVESKRVCDFTLDCPEGEDEDNCPSQCDFEDGSCGLFEFVPGDGFDWVRSSFTGLTAQHQHQAPPRDHTTNTSDGHFMFLQKNSSSFSQKAFLRGPKFSQAASGCIMTFWYFSSGNKVGAADMHLLIEGEDSVTILWRTLYHQGNQWHPVTVQLGRQLKPFQFSLTKLSLGMYDGMSAIDDLVFHNCSLPQPAVECPAEQFHCGFTRACINRLLLCDLVDDCGDGTDEESCSPDLMCDFEQDLCTWSQDTEGDVFNWMRVQGPTPTETTGPWADHTLANANGHYLYIESSAPQEFKDTAVLVSQPFKPSIWRDEHQSSSSCVFRFHYHMYGQHVFRLAVYMRTKSNGRGHMLWVRYGDQGNLWHRKTLFLNSAQPFQILLEGTVGDDFTGDIAIDDLSFLGCQPFEGALPSTGPTTTPHPALSSSVVPPHTCSEGQFVCVAHGECVALSQVCDFRHDCSDGSDELDCVKTLCNFEDSLCGWYLDHPSPQVHLHAFRWLTGQGSSIHQGEKNHRPSTDHTIGSAEGWYIYADSSNGGYGHTTDLLTPLISSTGPQCTLEFWYHMRGFTVGTFQVLILSESLTNVIWSQTGNQGNRWRRGEVFIGIQHNFQVILRAKRGVSYMGDVVVDDVLFTHCAPALKPPRPCRREEFTCANGNCIPHTRLCDFISDCGDDSDEEHFICKGSATGRCNFEFDLCSWRQCQKDDFDWRIKAGSTPTLGTGPSTDHTMRDASGNYLYLESSFPQKPGDIARISGPLFSPPCFCYMVFHTHMSGEGSGTLTIYQVSGSSHQLLLNLTGDQGNNWQRQEVTLSSSGHFWVMFEGRVGPNSRGDICLDDIIFSPGCILSKPETENEATPPPPSHGNCDNGGCFLPEQSCDFVDNCGDASDEKFCGTSCSFENGRCGWKKSLADNFDWTLGVGSIQSIRPPFDHTLKNEHGHFVYLEVTPTGLKGDKAHMRSSVWKESSATCKLTFYYFISHKAKGTIHLFVKTENNQWEVWTNEERAGEGWRRAEVPLRKLRNFQLIFEGVRSRDISGGAALDDLEFVDCAPYAVPGSCPSVTDFVCHDGHCIESHLICDHKADCADGSDEMDCSDLPGTCDFNLPEHSWQPVCQWSQESDDDFDWTIRQTSDNPGTGPMSDHSPDGQGSFLYANSAVQREGDVARVITRKEFPASTGVCHLRFWFYMYGSEQMGSLKVFTVGQSGTRLLMWVTSGNRGKEWHYGSVILSHAVPFSVVFQAEVGGDQWTDIAIDDVSFTTECSTGALVTPVPLTCSSGEFQCAYISECVPESWHCDGEWDCADHSDEDLCSSVSPGTVPPQNDCGPQRFQCADRSCLPALLRCDGVPDCPEGEDENQCCKTLKSDRSLVCEEISCIPYEKRCDVTVDCLPFQPDESCCHGNTHLKHPVVNTS